MPKDILFGLREMGFQHTIDMSYFLEMFQCATEEFIKRNRETRKAPWPLISPVCPVVVRLIAFQFPSLIPNVLPVLRPVALMAREVKRRIIPYYMETGEPVVLYYINPCPTKTASIPHSSYSGFSKGRIHKTLSAAASTVAGPTSRSSRSSVVIVFLLGKANRGQCVFRR